MVWSFIILVISLVLRTGVVELSKTYDFLLSWIQYFDYLLYGTAVIFVIFVVIYLIKVIKK